MRLSMIAQALLTLVSCVEFSLAQAPSLPIASQSELAWVTAEVKAPRVSFQTFDSDSAKAKVSYHIYKPAAYDRELQRRFPVVYWLHGSGGGLAGIPKVAAHFDAANAPSTNKQSEFEISFKVKQQDRRAVIVNASTDGTKTPVIIALHGGQGSAEIMRGNSGFDPVAKANGFMVVYGEGTDFGGNRHAWNTGFLLRRQVRDADDIAYLDTLIDKLISEHDADPTRIYMTGGSNGGMMTFVYAVARSERLAAVAPVVASMFTFDKKPSAPLPILIINGAKDEEVPIEGGMSRNPLVSRAQDAPYKPLKEVVQFWVETNKSQSPADIIEKGSVTTSVYSTVTGGAVTEFVVDAEGGHGWPGSRSRRDGNAPIKSFSGAERVWEFFKDKHR